MGRVRVVLVCALVSFAALPLYIVACGANHVPVGGDASTANDATPDHLRIPYDGLAPEPATARIPVPAGFGAPPVRTGTMQLMFAAGEMQTSGEPFAQNFAGRNLFYYIP